jgi:hypothetical protein
MHALVGEQLLTAWDRGFHESDLSRALTLLTVSSAQRSREDAAALSLAERDLELWRLRQMTFGDSLRATLPCSGCAAQMEFSLQLSTVIKSLQQPNFSLPAVRQMQGWQVTVAPATTLDLEAALQLPDQSSSTQALLERCTSMRDPTGSEARWNDVPAALRDCAVAVFEEIHEDAEFICAVTCPQCGAVEMADLDIGRSLWLEVRNAAMHLLREIHELARAYGWSESAIIAMSPRRRHDYLALVHA